MSITVTISGESSGDSLASLVDMGSEIPGDSTDHQDLFIRHSAIVNPITDCSFYLINYSGVDYPPTGNGSDLDYAEIMGWGADRFEAIPPPPGIGGFLINYMVPPGWVIGDPYIPETFYAFREGYGDIDSQIVLSKDAGGSATDGEIDVSGEAHIQVKFEIPLSPTGGSGPRAIQMVMAFSATS